MASIDAAHAGYFFRQVWIIVNGGRLDKFSNRALYVVTCRVPPRPRRVTWRVDTPMYQGPCPKVVNFAGSISAEPGAHVRYRIIVNGVPWGPVHSADVGSSGTLAVSETLGIDAGHAGYFSRQLWVMRNDLETDVYSKQALYSVVCLPGRPGPHANHTLFDISAPTEFASSGDPKLCGDHVEPAGAAALCGAPLANGQFVLVWNWKPGGCLSGPCRSRVDGYRIYQILGKGRRLIATQSHAALTIATFAQKTSAFAGNCYTVRAFLGNDESSDSNELCVKAGYGELMHMVLRPKEVIPLGSGDFGARFDLLKLSNGVAVWQAKLQFGKASEIAHRPGNFCIGAVDLVSVAAAHPGEGTVPADPYLGVAEYVSSVDVTSAVRAWVQGGYPNYGFVLRPADQHAAKYHGTCFSVERDLALAVDYLNL